MLQVIKTLLSRKKEKEKQISNTRNKENKIITIKVTVKRKKDKKDNLAMIGNTGNNDNLWIEKNINIKSEQVCICFYSVLHIY